MTSTIVHSFVTGLCLYAQNESTLRVKNIFCLLLALLVRERSAIFAVIKHKKLKEIFVKVFYANPGYCCQ